MGKPLRVAGWKVHCWIVASTVSSTPCPSPRSSELFVTWPFLSITTSTTTSPRVPEGNWPRSGRGEGCSTTRRRSRRGLSQQTRRCGQGRWLLRLQHRRRRASMRRVAQQHVVPFAIPRKAHRSELRRTIVEQKHQQRGMQQHRSRDPPRPQAGRVRLRVEERKLQSESLRQIEYRGIGSRYLYAVPKI
jgi:hypothetical protein